jgi:hypothetical protein
VCEKNTGARSYGRSVYGNIDKWLTNWPTHRRATKLVKDLPEDRNFEYNYQHWWRGFD